MMDAVKYVEANKMLEKFTYNGRKSFKPPPPPKNLAEEPQKHQQPYAKPTKVMLTLSLPPFL